MEFGLSGAFADTLEGVSTWTWLFSPSCNGGAPFVSESARACQYNFDLFRTLGDAGPQNANEGSFEILRTPVAAAVSAAKKHQFCQPSCARHRKKFAGDTPGH
jgi:hypothetical protein